MSLGLRRRSGQELTSPEPFEDDYPTAPINLIRVVEDEPADAPAVEESEPEEWKPNHVKLRVLRKPEGGYRIVYEDDQDWPEVSARPLFAPRVVEEIEEEDGMAVARQCTGFTVSGERCEQMTTWRKFGNKRVPLCHRHGGKRT